MKLNTQKQKTRAEAQVFLQVINSGKKDYNSSAPSTSTVVLLLRISAKPL